MIVVVGFSHKAAPIEVRERLAIGKDAFPELYQRLLRLAPVGEAVVLSTCNRVEVYAAPTARGDVHATADRVLDELTRVGGGHVKPHLGCRVGDDAVMHLFRVAASLDSLVVGEPQILGQLKEAIELAHDNRALGATLGNAMHRAVRVGKRVRSETTIGAGQVSVSSVAVDLARQIFGELEGHAALLVGAGEMAEAAAKLLAKGGAKLLVANRSPERAAALAKDVGGEPRSLADLERCLVEADIVVSSTSSPTHVVTVPLVKAARKQRRGRSLFLIDIAVPRDVDPAVNDLDGVYLYDVDDLSQIVADALQGRAAEAARAERIVEAEAQGFSHWTAERALAPAIVALRARTQALLAAEVGRSLSGKLKHLGEPEREALSIMVGAATNRLLHHPVTRLKAMASDPRAGEVVDLLRELFQLAEGEGEEAAAAEAPADGAPAVSQRRVATPAPPRAEGPPVAMMRGRDGES